ncbi:hypothetical protein ACFFQF_20375 [Haladaptatus pallidirubidus]|uniref:Uncharacterized protein n=1 Tax=Haladaptatus pallidirubidus TaxID=1008152 RepID=A0AAV3UGZ2_9EURY|nr:hypothetical protein [Haladaptatus pallidirubidus]
MAERFNSLLPDFKEQHPNNETIQQMEPVELVGSANFNPRSMGRAPKLLQTIKMNTLTLADALNIDTGEFEEAGNSGMQVINISQQQEANQEVDVQTTLDLVNHLAMPDSNKEKLREIVHEFEEEAESEDPDESRIRGLIGDAREYSKDVALKLVMVAGKRGIDILDQAQL